MEIAFGLDTFGDIARGHDGRPVHPAVVVREVLAEGRLADQVGVDVFGIGEHHRADYAVSSPDTLLAGLATTTSRIRLSSAVTVLSSDDPVRVFERFATVDALSEGRAEITVGRGSFVESFPLFGYNVADYERLFTEKIDLLVEVLKEGPVSWQGSHRAPLRTDVIQPRTAAGSLPLWVGVGGTPESVVRAARYRLPLVLAIIGGPAHRYLPLVELYRLGLAELGAGDLPVAVHSPGHVAETDEQAVEEYLPHFVEQYDKLGRERGWPPITLAAARAEVGPLGAAYVGSPETVATKIADTARLLGLARFHLKYSQGGLPHDLRMNSIRLYGERVAPRVRELLAADPDPSAGGALTQASGAMGNARESTVGPPTGGDGPLAAVVDLESRRGRATPVLPSAGRAPQ